jgi:hypothetical protein
VHAKLLGAFLLIAVLLIAMGANDAVALHLNDGDPSTGRSPPS